MSTEDVIKQIAQPVQTIACRKCAQHIDVSGQEFFSVIACPACQARQTVPAQLGHFLLFDVLGRGGMAAVYRAFDRTLSRQVAIKVMRRELGEDPKFIQDFLREARAAAQLNHPNIVQIYAVGEEGGQPYIVMELLDGGRLDEMIAKKGPLDQNFVLKTALDVAEGLSAATALGLVHGDIKPANILYDRAGTAKVADFGLARFQQRPAQKGEVWGTPYYIAPEKVRGQKEDHRSDIYSLGATLFHALTAKAPFEGETAGDVVMARLKTPPPKLEEARPDVHPATAALIARMLEPDPALRYPTYSSLLGDIRSTADIVRLGPKAPSSAHGKPVPARKPWVAILVAVVVIAAGVAAFLLLYKPSKSPKPHGAPPHTKVAVPTNPAVTSPPPPAAVLPVQPFSAAEQAELAKAAEALAKKDPAKAVSIWSGMAKSLPKEHGGRSWLALFTALPTWLSGDKIETDRRLNPLDRASFPVQSDGSPHPGLLPQALARVMLGQAYKEPAPKGGGSWPSWHAAFAEFIRGGAELAAGKPEAAIERLDRYSAWSGSDPAWVRGFQPVAADLRTQADEWRKFCSGLENRVKEGKGAEAVRDLEKRIKDRPVPLLAGAVDEQLKKLRKSIEKQDKDKAEAKKRDEENARKAREEEQKKKAADEISGVENLQRQIGAACRKKDFRPLLDAARQAEKQASTEDGRAAARSLKDSLERLDSLRRLLIDNVQKAPFRGPASRREFNGDIVAATGSGLTILLGGGVGTSERPWEQVNPRQFIDLCTHYASNAPMEDAARGNLMAGIALFAYHHPHTRPLSGEYAARARKLNPELESRLKQWMPDQPPPAPGSRPGPPPR